MDRIHKVHFDLDSDNNTIINAFIDFILDMYDEQLFFQRNNMSTLLKQIEIKDKEKEYDMDKIVSSSKMKKLNKLPK